MDKEAESLNHSNRISSHFKMLEMKAYILSMVTVTSLSNCGGRWVSTLPADEAL